MLTLFGACSETHVPGSSARDASADARNPVPPSAGEPGSSGSRGTGVPDAANPGRGVPGSPGIETNTDGGPSGSVGDGIADPLANVGPVERISPVPTTAFTFTEGPLWLAAKGTLLFSDIRNTNLVYEHTPPSTFTVFRRDSGGTNGMALDKDGSLLLCEGATGRLARKVGNDYLLVTDNIAGPLTSPNDVIARRDGNIYFTDQRGGRAFRINPAGQGAPFAVDQENPNGIALSPDEGTLYLTEDRPGRISQYPLAADGSVGARAVFTANAPGADGLGIDDAGNVYAATTAGIRVFDRAGRVLGTVAVPQRPTNVSFGGADRKTLFITAQSGVYRISMVVPGKP